MKITLIVSAFTGLAWSLLAVLLMGGTEADWFRASFILGGICAGSVAGAQTARTREKRNGRESVLAGMACYYIAIFIFWAVWFTTERIGMCISRGGWTDFDLSDHLNMLVIYFVYGTIPPWGLFLVPLCFLNRYFVWKIYERSEGKPNQPEVATP